MCHFCHETGHKALNCPKLPPGMKVDDVPSMQQSSTLVTTDRMAMPMERKPIGEVTCFKCGEKGHYANKCTKGHLAFLSNPAIGTS